MADAKQTIFLHARRAPSFVSGALLAIVAIVYFVLAIDLRDAVLQFKHSPWPGVLLAMLSAAALYTAFRRFPILRINDSGLEIETLWSRRRWCWRQTGPFSFSPELGTSIDTLYLAAMYPGNIDEYESASKRLSPDFVDADISINLIPYFRGISEVEEQKVIAALLEAVQNKRAKALLRMPLDATYTGPAKRSRLGQVLRMRRIRFFVPIVISLLWMLYNCSGGISIG